MVLDQPVGLFLGGDILIDGQQLQSLVVGLEHDLLCHQLVEDAAQCPHIDGIGVAHGAPQQLGCPVVESAHLVGHSNGLVPFALLGHPEVDDLQVQGVQVVQHDVGRLQVPVQNEVAVH